MPSRQLLYGIRPHRGVSEHVRHKFFRAGPLPPALMSVCTS
jgi:hypothetical protein